MRFPASLVSALVTVSTMLSPAALSQYQHVDPLLSGSDVKARVIDGDRPLRISTQPVW